MSFFKARFVLCQCKFKKMNVRPGRTSPPSLFLETALNVLICFCIHFSIYHGDILKVVRSCNKNLNCTLLSQKRWTQTQTLFIRQISVQNNNYIFNVFRPRWRFSDTPCMYAYDFMTIEILKTFRLIDSLKLREKTDGGSYGGAFVVV